MQGLFPDQGELRTAQLLRQPGPCRHPVQPQGGAQTVLLSRAQRRAVGRGRHLADNI